HLRDDLGWDIAVGSVPFLRMRHDIAVGELAHLAANSIERFLKPALSYSGIVMGRQQLDQPGAPLDPPGGQTLQRAGDGGTDGIEREPTVAWARNLPEIHWNAARNLLEIFTNAERDD